VKDLKGKLVLLTGASSGLGPHLARRLDEEGCRFILSARRREELDRVAAELREARVVAADLSQRGEAERLAEAAGPVDVLIANAGVPASGRLTDFQGGSAIYSETTMATNGALHEPLLDMMALRR